VVLVYQSCLQRTEITLDETEQEGMSSNGKQSGPAPLFLQKKQPP
jgi:hypothetical protein